MWLACGLASGLACGLASGLVSELTILVVLCTAATAVELCLVTPLDIKLVLLVVAMVPTVEASGPDELGVTTKEATPIKLENVDV